MKTVFIDRDGTMGGDAAIRRPEEYRPFAGTKKAFSLLRENGFAPMVFTNQSCIARGLDGGYDFAFEFREIGAVDWFICPHDAPDGCRCRKPEIGLLLQAKEKYGLCLSECFVIGDRWSDMLAGGRAGCRLITVLTGAGRDTVSTERCRWKDYQAEYTAADLLDAAEWIVKNADSRNI